MCGIRCSKKRRLARMESFEDEGLFWLPGGEQEQRAGRLKFDSAEGGTLSIIGGFGSFPQQFTNQERLTRLHGVAGGRFLTLDRCLSSNTSVRMPGTAFQTFHVGQIITGHLFADGEALTFDQFSVDFDQLPMWIRLSGLQVSFQTAAPDPNQTPPDKILIEFNQLQDEVAQVGDQELRLKSTWSLGGNNVTETHLYQGTFLQLTYPKPQPLDDIVADIKHLQDLLTLMTAAPTVPVEILLQRSDITQELSSGENRPQSMKYFAGQLAERVRLTEPQTPGHVLFQFQDIGGLPTIARWIKVARQYRIVLGYLLSIRYATGLYTENRFGNVISAAETFHRLRFPNEVMPGEKFTQRLQEILAEISKSSRRSWVKGKLKHSNEPRLADRLKEMVGHVNAAFAQVYADADAWITVVVESRNRLTHHDEERKLNFEPGDLHFLAESVFTLVMLNLLRECDMGDAALMAIGDSPSTQFLQSKLSEITPRLHKQIESLKTS